MYYADLFNGGYCFNGFDPSYNGGGTQSVPIPVPLFSQERRTFVFAHRVGNAPNLTITIQGQPFTFDASNQVTPIFQSSPYGGNSAVHAIDITGIFNININNFAFNIPLQPGPANRYTGFILYRSFLRASAGPINAFIELNQYNYQTLSPTWQMNMPPPLQPISTAFPVALGLWCDYICDCDSDGTRVFVNGNPTLGVIGENPPSFGICGGPAGSHLYWGTTFTPLLTNNINLAMACQDALSDIRTRVNNGDLTFALNFNTVVTNPSNLTNCVWAAIGGYKGTGSPSPYECPACGTYTVTNLLPTSATLNWSSCAPHGASFINDVQYRAVGSPTWIVTTVITDSFLNIAGLTSGVQYEWQVINVDSDGAICSPSSTQVFTTP